MINTVSAPRINTNDDEFEVVAWHVADGAWVNAGDELADVETSKAVVTINAESAGYVRPLVAVSCVVRVGEPLYLCASTAEALAQPVQRPADVTPVSAAVPDVAEPSAPRLSRAAQRMAAERGIATDSFRGLVTARALAGNAPAAANAVETNAARATALPPAAIAPAGPAVPRRERVSRGKLAEAQALATGERGNINSLLTVYFDSAAVRARLLREQSFDGNIQPLILFEISRLLKQWPQFTAYFDDGEIRYYDRIDLGVAMDLGQGLKVVTLRDASRLMPIEIFEQTIAAGLRYLDNKLTPEELTGSTLTVTDLSGFNVLHFHPLINGHQSAIIGIGGDAGQPGHPMSLNMTFDHRVANGRDVAMFLNELRARLLSYAPSPAADADASDRVGNPAMPDGKQCDTCGIQRAPYYRDAGAAAYLLVYIRENGTPGCVCHRCFGGWT